MAHQLLTANTHTPLTSQASAPPRDTDAKQTKKSVVFSEEQGVRAYLEDLLHERQDYKTTRDARQEETWLIG
ncbi:hypothetical protein DPMN_007880 [Dreissena polymorpha]|uniref:Uncharacterized protein n=1 Tax=Dreissena polymorpha TaxID=45954 RepID=A0A9D4MU36_DREPO|nr:hypothetical protein DPMN_007880 [Dreissena polymorpha]